MFSNSVFPLLFFLSFVVSIRGMSFLHIGHRLLAEFLLGLNVSFSYITSIFAETSMTTRHDTDFSM